MNKQDYLDEKDFIEALNAAIIETESHIKQEPEEQSLDDLSLLLQIDLLMGRKEDFRARLEAATHHTHTGQYAQQSQRRQKGLH